MFLKKNTVNVVSIFTSLGVEVVREWLFSDKDARRKLMWALKRFAQCRSSKSVDPCWIRARKGSGPARIGFYAKNIMI